jgi:hypothetical protein
MCPSDDPAFPRSIQVNGPQCVVFVRVRIHSHQKILFFDTKEGGDAGFLRIPAQNLFEHHA